MKTYPLIAAFVLLSFAPLLAQHGAGADHKHSSPHGGAVKSSGDYHLELLQKAGMLTVYLLDKNEKTMAVTGTTGTALLQTEAGQVTTAKLTPTGAQQLTTTLDKTKAFHKAIVNVTVGGKSVSASFDLMAANQHADGHTGHKH